VADGGFGLGRWPERMTRRLGMRRIGIIVTVGLIVVASVVAHWIGESGAQTKELVIAAWGDPYETGWRKALIPAFEKKYGVKVVWVPGFSSQTLAKLLAQKDSPQVDLAMLDDGPHRQAVTAGLVERVDRSKLSNLPQLIELAYEPNDFGIGFGVDGIGMFYNTKSSPRTSGRRRRPGSTSIARSSRAR
jgi:putative spermidine/putrescine transport system substrate-binding protein